MRLAILALALVASAGKGRGPRTRPVPHDPEFEVLQNYGIRPPPLKEESYPGITHARRMVAAGKLKRLTVIAERADHLDDVLEALDRPDGRRGALKALMPFELQFLERQDAAKLKVKEVSPDTPVEAGVDPVVRVVPPNLDLVLKALDKSGEEAEASSNRGTAQRSVVVRKLTRAKAKPASPGPAAHAVPPPSATPAAPLPVWQ